MWPGSLGLEAFKCNCSRFAVKRWGIRAQPLPYLPQKQNTFGPIADGVLPTDQKVTVEAQITAVDDAQGSLVAKVIYPSMVRSTNAGLCAADMWHIARICHPWISAKIPKNLSLIV
ncbi:MAG: hypothetical protein R3C68_05050 [Myxococcota bacterium]